eukprot:CAMPEP_0194142362 /NCGR_PEP_ID=MMETSP0152-20130528/11631_1 /TAXON_ID=1049557 /ORGANISM="Thalassiothrix antarctica, Strain L6-D1" /LENGTH=461 /DNA_ID=CAMNT_0038841285 /DNA_START=48 /DNA_END=1430 /DNA_ORIENTATION=+
MNKFAVFGALLCIIVWSFLPVSLEKKKANDGTLPAKTVYRLGKSSHLLPAIRVINWVLHPIRKQLVPLHAPELKALAINLVYGNDKPVGSYDAESELFGDLASWDAFEQYVKVIDDSAHFSGRFSMKQTIVDYLAVNVYIQKRFRENPEIADEKIERPIFLASYTRSGGTFTYQVLSDIFEEQLTPVRQFEIIGGPFDLHHSPINRIQKAETGMKAFKYMNAPMSLMHEWSLPEDPDEDAGWYGYTFTGLANSFLVPSRHHLHLWLDQSHQTKWHNLLEAILKIKQFDDQGRRNRRVILKSPEHLVAMKNVINKFPGAQIVVIDRDEIPWYKSALMITHQVQYQVVPEPKIDESLYFTDVLMCAMKKARDFALSKNNDAEVLHLQFSGLFNQTFDYAEQFAQFTGLPWDQNMQEHAKRVISKRLSWKKSKTYYAIDEFGITENYIQNRLTECDKILKNAVC